MNNIRIESRLTYCRDNILKPQKLVKSSKKIRFNIKTSKETSKINMDDNLDLTRPKYLDLFLLTNMGHSNKINNNRL